MTPERTRRSFLRRGAIAAAGGFGAILAAPSTVQAAEATGGRRLVLFGQGWHSNTFRPERAGVASPFSLTERGDQVVSWGTLHNARGRRVGDFYSSGHVVFAPLSSRPSASFEQHAFVLADGSVFGMGTVPADQTGLLEFGIVGGTGKYSSSRGSYTMVQRPLELGGDGTAEFVLTIV